MKKENLRDLAFYAKSLLRLQEYDVASKRTNRTRLKPQTRRVKLLLSHKSSKNALKSVSFSSNSVSTRNNKDGIVRRGTHCISFVAYIGYIILASPLPECSVIYERYCILQILTVQKPQDVATHIYYGGGKKCVISFCDANLKHLRPRPFRGNDRSDRGDMAPEILPITKTYPRRQRYQ